MDLFSSYVMYHTMLAHLLSFNAEKILKSKQTIGEQLEACRPTHTADKRRTSALITPTLYHYVSPITPTL